MERLGTKLKESRERLKMTRAEVSSQTARIAEMFKNPDCWISESWLRRIENCEGEPGGVKLMTLIYLYGLDVKDFLGAADTVVDSVDKQWRHHLSPERHLLVESGPLDQLLELLLPAKYEPPPDRTKLLDNDADFSSKRYVRAIVGRKENRMYPLLRPGAVVLIDRKRRDIKKRVNIGHETECPVFFFETHDDPVFGWVYARKNRTVDIMAHTLANMDPINMLLEEEARLVGQAVAVLMWYVEDKL